MDLGLRDLLIRWWKIDLDLRLALHVDSSVAVPASSPYGG